MNFKKFTTESITLWLYQNFKQVLVVLVIPLVVLLGWVVQKEWNDKQEAQMYQTIYPFYSQLKEAEEAANSPGYRDKSNNIYTILKDSKKDKSLVYSEDMARLAGEYEAQIRSHKGSLAGASFAIDLADFYYTHNKNQQATDLLSQFAFFQKKSSIYHLVTVQLANYYMNDKNCSEAIPLWRGLVENKKAGYFHKEAYIQLGLCLENQGDHAQAEEIYNKIIDESSNEFDTQKAKDYKRLMNLQRKLNK